MLFSMLNNTKYSVEELSKEHQKYSKYFEKNKSNGRIIFTNERSKNKVLNVGFVSGDFRDHPVSDYFTPVLASIAENSSIRTFGYYNYNVSDGRTAELKKYFFKWRSIWGISDRIVINKIKNDKIDILIDLSGHTAYNRLKLFTKKPAPVQASMFGYPFTTGLKSIDYFIGAKNAFSERYKQNFSEKIVELPYNPPYLPKTKELQIENFPIFSNKHITFGSFFNVNKLNSEVLELWTSIMNNIPSSRLVVGNVSGIETEQRLINIFKKQNISGKRLDFIPKLNYPEFLKMHNKIDVCLAPFPNSGGTTILCALWMGVPTLIYQTLGT